MDEILMIWNCEGEQIVKQLREIAERNGAKGFMLHVFVAKNAPCLPFNASWIAVHKSRTDTLDAAKVNLIAFVLQKYWVGNKEGMTRGLERTTIYLLQQGGHDHEELLGLLDLSDLSKGFDVKLLYGHRNPCVPNAKSDFTSDTCKHCRPNLKACKHCSILKRNLVDHGSTLPCNGSCEDFALVELKGTSDRVYRCITCGAMKRLESCVPNDQAIRMSWHPKGPDHTCGWRVQGVACNGETKDCACACKKNEGSATKPLGKIPSCFQCCKHCLGFQCMRSSCGIYCCKSCHEADSEGAAYTEPIHAHEKSENSVSINSRREKCSCSEESTKVCLGYLLSKLSRPVPKWNFRGSHSAPKLLSHRDTRPCSDRHLEITTTDIATNTKDSEFYDGLDKRQGMIFVEKSTGTNDNLKLFLDKATSMNDLENIAPIEDSTSSLEVRDERKVYFQENAEDSGYSCLFCHNKTYRSKELLAVHMRNNHKKCNCPCQQYFRTREDYLAHFYSVYPLPCLMHKKCPERFRNLYYQSLHHKESHYAEKPFFCIPCHQSNVENGANSNRSMTFKDVASLRIHSKSYGHEPQELFLVSDEDEADKSCLPFSMRCSGINYC